MYYLITSNQRNFVFIRSDEKRIKPRPCINMSSGISRLRLWSEKEIVVLMLKSYTYNSKNTARIVAYGNVTLLPVDDLYRPSSTVSLGMAWNRMHLFNLTDYSRLVYIDAASTVVDSLDPLFDLVALDSPSIIAAGLATMIFDYNSEYVDSMSTQLMVVKPNTTVFETIMASRTNPDSSIFAFYPKSVALLDKHQYYDNWYDSDNNAQWNSLKVLLYKGSWSYTPPDQNFFNTYRLQAWLNWFTESKIYCSA
eukprot:gene10206-11888_t